jgi:hypothetical protein
MKRFSTRAYVAFMVTLGVVVGGASFAGASSHPASLVDSPVSALSDVFSANWPAFAAFAIAAIGIAIAVALFRRALNWGKGAVTGKAAKI